MSALKRSENHCRLPESHTPHKELIASRTAYARADQQPGQPHPCAPPEIMKEFGSFGSPERQREIAERASASASGTQNQGQKSPNPGPTTQKQSPPPASPSSDRAPSRSSSSSASSSSSSSKPPSGAAKGLPPVDYEEFFEAPKRYWTQPPLEDAEMEAVMVSGPDFTQLATNADNVCACSDRRSNKRNEAYLMLSSRDNLACVRVKTMPALGGISSRGSNDTRRCIA